MRELEDAVEDLAWARAEVVWQLQHGCGGYETDESLRAAIAWQEKSAAHLASLLSEEMTHATCCSRMAAGVCRLSTARGGVRGEVTQ
jgi:predicted transcriptional regulator